MQELAEFDFELRHVLGKKHVPADFLSRPFGENQGKDDNEDLVLLPPARFTLTDFPDDLESRRHVLQAYHDHPLAGHPGIANTIHLLEQTYHGKDMKDFAEDYVKGCATCQQNKPCTTHRKAPLQPITTDPHSGPFQMVAMDLITDLPQSRGFNAVLTIIDHGCSKAAKFILCNTTITGQEVAALYLQHLVPWFSIPQKIISDRDPRFVSNFTTELCRLLNIQQNMSTAFHPRMDGASEQANQWLEQYLRIWTADDQMTCAQFLLLAEFVHNSWPHDRTKLTPHELLFGTKPPFPLSNEEMQTPEVANRLKQIKEARDKAEKAL
jgi:hypothetical protein